MMIIYRIEFYNNLLTSSIDYKTGLFSETHKKEIIKIIDKPTKYSLNNLNSLHLLCPEAQCFNCFDKKGRLIYITKLGGGNVYFYNNKDEVIKEICNYSTVFENITYPLGKKKYCEYIEYKRKKFNESL